MKDYEARLKELHPIELPSFKIGRAPSAEDYERWYEEGEIRFPLLVPPGYKDAHKKKEDSENPLHHRGCHVKRRFGDLLVWKQVLEEFENSGTHIILLTEDSKDDWFQRSSGNTAGPRRELREEARSHGIGIYWSYSVNSFLRQAKKSQNVEVRDQSLALADDLTRSGRQARRDNYLVLIRDAIAICLENSSSQEFDEAFDFLLDGIMAGASGVQFLVEKDLAEANPVSVAHFFDSAAAILENFESDHALVSLGEFIYCCENSHSNIRAAAALSRDNWLLDQLVEMIDANC